MEVTLRVGLRSILMGTRATKYHQPSSMLLPTKVVRHIIRLLPFCITTHPGAQTGWFTVTLRPFQFKAAPTRMQWAQATTKEGEDGTGRGQWDLEQCIRFRDPTVGNPTPIVSGLGVPTTCFHLLVKKSMLLYVLLIILSYSCTEHFACQAPSPGQSIHTATSTTKSPGPSPRKPFFQRLFSFAKIGSSTGGSNQAGSRRKLHRRHSTGDSKRPAAMPVDPALETGTPN